MKVKTASASSEKKLPQRCEITAGKNCRHRRIRRADAAEIARRAKKSLLEGDHGHRKKHFEAEARKIRRQAGPETEVTAETHVRRTYTRHKKIEPPAILLEGDSPARAAGQRARAKNFPSARRRLHKVFRGRSRTARILRHKKTFPHRARPSLALRALGSDARAAVEAERAVRRRPSGSPHLRA